MAAMVSLRLPELTRPASRGGEASQSAGIATDIPPSPLGELGSGVIVADDQPKEFVPLAAPIRLPAADDGPALPDPEILQHVLDKTSDRTKRPFYHLLSLATAVSPESLDANARRDVRYADLWHEPEPFRGTLIHLEGYLRGLHAWQATDDPFFNPVGLQTLFDGYLITDDSRPNAFVIVVPRIAPGMPTGSNILEKVTFSGYFLKLWRYRAADGTERAAPLLVGQLIAWTPAPVHERFAQLSGYLAAAFLLLIMAVGGAIWMVNRRKLSKTELAFDDVSIRSGLAELEKMDITDPIAELGKEHPAAESGFDCKDAETK